MTTVTTVNIETGRETMAAIDQQAELAVGCETWAIFCDAGQQRGQMTVWPAEGRGAVCHGSDSQWGDWDASSRRLTLDTGEIVDDHGCFVES